VIDLTEGSDKFSQSDQNILRRGSEILNWKHSKVKLKDSCAPPRPANGYMRFVNEKREEVKNSGEKISNQQITVKLANMWNNLPDVQKSVYNTQSREAMKEYHERMKAYRKTPEYKQHQEKMVLKKLSAVEPKLPEGHPIKPPSAYNMYKSSILQNEPSRKPRKINEEWQRIAPQDKTPWLEKYNGLFRAYERDLKRFSLTNEYRKYIDKKILYEKFKKVVNNAENIPEFLF